MSQMSDYLENSLVTHIFRTGSFTKPTQLGIALSAASVLVDSGNGSAGIGELANANGYYRPNVPPLDANWANTNNVNGLTSNSSDITFPTATASWGAVSGVAIIDASGYGAGNMLLYGMLSSAKTVGTGDTFKFTAGNLTITFA